MRSKTARAKTVTNARRITTLSRRVKQISNRTYGHMQLNMHEFGQVNVTRDTPLLINASNMQVLSNVYTVGSPGIADLNHPDPDTIRVATQFTKPTLEAGSFWGGCNDDLLEGSIHKCLSSTYTFSLTFRKQRVAQRVRIDMFTMKKQFTSGLLQRRMPQELHQLRDMAGENRFCPIYFKHFGKPKIVYVPAADDIADDAAIDAQNVLRDEKKVRLYIKHNKVVKLGQQLSEAQEAIIHDNLGQPADIHQLQADFGYLNRPINSNLWIMISTDYIGTGLPVVAPPFVKCTRVVSFRDQNGVAT